MNTQQRQAGKNLSCNVPNTDKEVFLQSTGYYLLVGNVFNTFVVHSNEAIAWRESMANSSIPHNKVNAKHLSGSSGGNLWKHCCFVKPYHLLQASTTDTPLPIQSKIAEHAASSLDSTFLASLSLIFMNHPSSSFSTSLNTLTETKSPLTLKTTFLIS